MSKILLVEDDIILAKAIVIALKEAGFTTKIALDGEAGLMKARDFKPDLILLDLLMPKKSGEDVLAELKKDKKTKNIPVFIVTVRSEPEAISLCTRLGAEGYFVKSNYTLAEIVREVKKHLKKRA